uniref:Uncharacterized protein n=1 Tax=Plectus sambesii TaxID=2011161 RepID=A0A914URD3_9BILA
MKKAILYVALFGCLLALSAAQGDEPKDDQVSGEAVADPKLGNDDAGEDGNDVKEGAAAGHYGRRHHHHFRRRHHNRQIERSTCSVQASYFLSVNRERRYCIDAVHEHDDCQACCEAATRRETRGVDKDDVTGFISVGGNYGRGGGRDKECVCCIPNKHHHHHHRYFGGGYY